MRGLVFLSAAALTLPQLASIARADEHLKFDDLPQPVQKTAQEHVRNGKITEIDKEMEAGKEVYEIDFERDNKRYQMEISRDGSLLELDD